MKRLLRIMDAIMNEDQAAQRLEAGLKEGVADSAEALARSAVEEFVELGYHKAKMPSDGAIRNYIKNSDINPVDIEKSVRLAKAALKKIDKDDQ